MPQLIAIHATVVQVRITSITDRKQRFLVTPLSNPVYKVLIVEDIAADREQYRRYLLAGINCTYQVLEAESVAAGLELCRSQPIDVILLNYSMPDADGLDFLMALKAESNAVQPAVVILTGQDHESTVTKAIKLGAEDYLVKSNFTSARLQTTINNAIERTRMRRELGRPNQELRMSIDTMIDCFGTYSAIRDAGGNIIDFRFDYLNAAALENNQMTATDMTKGLCELFPAIRTTGLFVHYCQVVETGVPFVEDALIYTDRFGTQQMTKAYEVRVNKLNDGFAAAWRDVTLHRQAEEERDRFFDLSIDLLAVGNFAGYFIRLNPAFEKVLGFTNAELMAQPFLEFVHPDDRAHTIIGAERISVGHEEVEFENRYRRKDGAYRLLSWNVIPCIESQRWYAVARDITDRKQVQTALEAHNRELESFTHIVSHDLKAPLRAVSNLSQWIEEDLKGTLSSETQLQMSLLRSRVDRMSATIDGLLNYARVGRTADTITLVSVTELLAETIDSLAPPPTFTIVISPPMPILKTNRLLLSQVFANLISNGIKHHDRSDGRIQISCKECPDLYQFFVTDDGPGIALQNHDKIFTIFQAVSRENCPDSTGIGLSIVKKIIENVGGTIQLESAIGKGATFCFTWQKQS